MKTRHYSARCASASARTIFWYSAGLAWYSAKTSVKNYIIVLTQLAPAIADESRILGQNVDN